MTQYIPKIISAAVGLALLGVGAWLLVAGHADEGAGLLAASLAMLGAVGTMALPSLAPAKKKPDPKRDAIIKQLLDERDRGTVPPSDGALALALCVIAAACAVAASGCSAGPQLPVVTVPINIACSWNINPPRSGGEATVDTPTSADATASWVVADNDCTVDRSSAAGEANPIGNDLHGAQVSPSLTASVPISGTGGATP